MMKIGSAEYETMIASDPLTGAGELWRLDIEVGNPVNVSDEKGDGWKNGTVTALCNQRSFPMKIRLEGESRDIQPFFDRIGRGHKIK